MWQVILAACIVSFTAYYFYVKYKMTYWRRQGITEDPGYFPFGSQAVWDLFSGKCAFSEITNSPYKRFPNAQVVGTYGVLGTKALMIRDPELAKSVLVHFTERKPTGYNAYNPDTKNNRYLQYMLTELRGQKWKNVRASLTPVFTSGKLKAMVPLIHRVADNCETYLDKNIGVELEAKEMLKGYTMDVIISTGFGYENDSLNDTENMFRKHADKLVGKTFSWKLMVGLLLLLVCPKLLRWLDFPFFDQKTEDFFAALVLKAINERKASGEKRNDLIDVCMEILEKERKENEEKSGDESTEEMEKIIIANSLIMFLAGFDTVSNAASLVLYFLAENPDLQEKLYQEIQEAVDTSGSNQFDYATIMGMSYMEKFFQESLRMYPMTHLDRSSDTDYKIPGTEIVIPKGIFVRWPATAVVKDEKYFPNPEVFDPENFSAERKSSRHPFVSGGFGHGPRNCIAQRFATMEIKIVIARLLSKYKIVPCSKTVDKLVPDPKSRSGQPKGELWIAVERR